METITYKGKKCIPVPVDTFNRLSEKILAQKELIQQFQEDLKKME